MYAVAEGYYSALGSTGASLKNSSEYAVLWVYTRSLNDTKPRWRIITRWKISRVAIALNRAFAPPCKTLEEPDEAIRVRLSHIKMVCAFNAANAKRDAVKTFEYGKELLLGREQTAKTVIIVLGAINNYNYADTDCDRRSQKSISLKRLT